MRVIVCGGRDFGWPKEGKSVDQCAAEALLLKTILDGIHEVIGITEVVEGDAIGADKLAGLWCEWNDISCKKERAQWKRYGKRAGPIRNGVMLEKYGKIDYVIAMPGGNGTANMIEQARDVPVKVIEVV